MSAFPRHLRVEPGLWLKTVELAIDLLRLRTVELAVDLLALLNLETLLNALVGLSSVAPLQDQLVALRRRERVERRVGRVHRPYLDVLGRGCPCQDSQREHGDQARSA